MGPKYRYKTASMPNTDNNTAPDILLSHLVQTPHTYKCYSLPEHSASSDSPPFTFDTKLPPVQVAGRCSASQLHQIDCSVECLYTS